MMGRWLRRPSRSTRCSSSSRSGSPLWSRSAASSSRGPWARLSSPQGLGRRASLRQWAWIEEVTRQSGRRACIIGAPTVHRDTDFPGGPVGICGASSPIPSARAGSAPLPRTNRRGALGNRAPMVDDRMCRRAGSAYPLTGGVGICGADPPLTKPGAGSAAIYSQSAPVATGVKGGAAGE
jgi:hypothetical protein